MDEKLSNFIKELKSLKDIIEKASIDEKGFQVHGWNIVHLTKGHIIDLLANNINKINCYGDSKITEPLNSALNRHIKSIILLRENSKSHFINNPNHLLHSVPVILLTLQTIFSDIDHELFSYENIQDKKLLPKGLATRLRGVDSRLKKFEDSSSNLNEKINSINEAHEAAESLPTDLANLREARNELTELINSANKEFDESKQKISSLKDEILTTKNQAKQFNEEISEYKEKIASSAQTASQLTKECDDALQITTTQGLAAGFDQKANELKKSIWIWTIGLLIALTSGAWIGADRVSAFTEALKHDLTAGQAILHTIMSIFSIGGPLWLAWISTQQINQRFKLSEDYAYKATIAKSFTGFKKFAERFDTETEERLFNSTLDRFDEMPLRLLSNKDYNSPWHEFIDSESFKKAISTFPNLAKDASKFASKANLNKKIKKESSSLIKETRTINNEPDE